METARCLALLFVLLHVLFVLGRDSVEKTPVAPTCAGSDDEVLMKNGRLIRCLNCKNLADNVDHSTDEVCSCPEHRNCFANETTVESGTVYEYYCTTKQVDETAYNSGLFLGENHYDYKPSTSGR